VDAGYTTGSVISTNYDAMLAKVIAWAPTREGAARRLAAALAGARLHGVQTNRDLLVGILRSEDFVAGRTDTGFLDRHTAAGLASDARDPDDALACVAAALWQRLSERPSSPQPGGIPAAWRNVGPADQPRRYLLRGSSHSVLITGRHGARRVTLDGVEVQVRHVEVTASGISAELDGRHVRAQLAHDDGVVNVDGSLGSVVLVEEPRLRVPEAEEAPGSMHAPLPGGVRRVTVSEGDTVAAGDVLMVLEAMKMEHAIRAPHDGTVSTVLVVDGQQVEGGDVLAVVLPVEAGEP
jgi:propionyl-CoA carboxylase alpha chain